MLLHTIWEFRTKFSGIRMIIQCFETFMLLYSCSVMNRIFYFENCDSTKKLMHIFMETDSLNSYIIDILYKPASFIPHKILKRFRFSQMFWLKGFFFHYRFQIINVCPKNFSYFHKLCIHLHIYWRCRDILINHTAPMVYNFGVLTVFPNTFPVFLYVFHTNNCFYFSMTSSYY